MYDKPISYSGKSLWKQCPKRWHNAYVLGNREPSGAAADRGTYLHELLENYFNGSPYPSGNAVLVKWQEYMEELMTHSPAAEAELAVLPNWLSCNFDDPLAYFRGKKDLDYVEDGTLYLYDWKSGKMYDDHVHQGKAYVALSPLYERYVVRFVYLDIPHVVKEWKYTKDDALSFRDEITVEVEAIRNAEEYPAIPGDHCGYCKLSWRNGGECKRGR